MKQIKYFFKNIFKKKKQREKEDIFQKLTKEEKRFCLSIKNRCTGRTTQIVDSIVQELMSQPPMTYIKVIDHHYYTNGIKSNMHLLQQILRRLSIEHPNVNVQRDGNIIWRTNKLYHEKVMDLFNDPSMIDLYITKYRGHITLETFVNENII